VREETGLDVEIEDYLGTWIDVYADDPGDPEAGVINVVYYTASLASDAPESVDPAEVSELQWFAPDELPSELAPPGTLEAVLAAATSPGRSRPR
jgi:ADP-ribose pyrophosphatase YjhB (NUDIX family)